MADVAVSLVVTSIIVGIFPFTDEQVTCLYTPLASPASPATSFELLSVEALIGVGNVFIKLSNVGIAQAASFLAKNLNSLLGIYEVHIYHLL